MPPNAPKIISLNSKTVMHQNPEGHYERNFMTALRAMNDFLLKPEHLNGLRVTYRRSPNELDPPVRVYWRKDVEAKSIQIWGTIEAMEQEKEKRRIISEDQEVVENVFKRILVKLRRKKRLERANWPARVGKQTPEPEGLGSDSGKVVLTAIGINGTLCIAKGVAWLGTGSHALFSEMIHSAADTLNQVRNEFVNSNCKLFIFNFLL